MLRRGALVRTDVSEERIASIGSICDPHVLLMMNPHKGLVETELTACP
jgi:hypothetical protein